MGSNCLVSVKMFFYGGYKMLKKIIVGLSVLSLASCSTAGINTLQSKETKNKIPVYVRSGVSDIVPDIVNETYCDSGYTCTKVTICAEDGTCKTINGILVDTGSVGLRIKKEALGSLNKKLIKERTKKNVQVTNTLNLEFKGIVTGPVKLAEVVIGGKKEKLPIQVVENSKEGYDMLYDSFWPGVRVNGILGIGLDNDTTKTEGVYYAGDKRIFVQKKDRVVNPIEKYGVVYLHSPAVQTFGTAYGYIDLKAKMPKRFPKEWPTQTSVVVTTIGVNKDYVCGDETFENLNNKNLFLDYKHNYVIKKGKMQSSMSITDGSFFYKGLVNEKFEPSTRKELKKFNCLNNQLEND